MGKTDEGVKVVATNRKARHRFMVEDTFEAGLALVGAEVKSLRDGGCSIEEAFAKPAGNEVYVYDMHIPPYRQATIDRPDPTRRRKVLLHRREIDRIIARCTQRGYTLVPLKVYFKEGWAKVELALCRSRNVGDKRTKEKKKEQRREVDSAMARRARRRGA
jgi:SsrA-binding protein